MSLINNNTFGISKWWLTGAMELVRQDPSLFSNVGLRNTMTRLVAGSGVVKAIQSWLLALDIIDKNSSGHTLTTFGLELYKQDKMLSNSSSWWAIHLALCFSERGQPYSTFFEVLDGTTKDWSSKDVLSKVIISNLEQDGHAERSITSNLSGIMGLFKDSQPLYELGLIEKRNDSNEFRIGTPESSDTVVLHALSLAKASFFESRVSVDFKQLCSDSLIHNYLCFTINDLRDTLHRMNQSGKYKQYFTFDNAVDLESITFEPLFKPKTTVLQLLRSGGNSWK